MQNYKLKFKIIIFPLSRARFALILGAAIFYFLLSAFYASAQTAPQFLISWRTDSYAPAWYQGKIFPTKGSQIQVSFELIDKGKIADISKNKVRWYVNGKLKRNEENGLGLKSFSFIADNYPGQDVEVRITIVDYKNGEQLDKIIAIPIINPEAIIDAPYRDRKISTGANSFRVYPFFFNIKSLNELSFEWLVNNAATEKNERSDLLDLKIDSLAPSGFGVNIRAIIKSLFDEMAFANNNINVEVK